MIMFSYNFQCRSSFSVHFLGLLSTNQLNELINRGTVVGDLRISIARRVLKTWGYIKRCPTFGGAPVRNCVQLVHNFLKLH